MDMEDNRLKVSELGVVVDALISYVKKMDYLANKTTDETAKDGFKRRAEEGYKIYLKLNALLSERSR